MPPKTVRRKPLFKKNKDVSGDSSAAEQLKDQCPSKEDQYGQSIRRRRKRSLMTGVSSSPGGATKRASFVASQTSCVGGDVPHAAHSPSQTEEVGNCGGGPTPSKQAKPSPAEVTDRGQLYSSSSVSGVPESPKDSVAERTVSCMTADLETNITGNDSPNKTLVVDSCTEDIHPCAVASPHLHVVAIAEDCSEMSGAHGSTGGGCGLELEDGTGQGSCMEGFVMASQLLGCKECSDTGSTIAHTTSEQMQTTTGSRSNSFLRNHTSPPLYSPALPTVCSREPHQDTCLGEGRASSRNEYYDEEELLYGLCPEDLSFSFNTSTELGKSLCKSPGVDQETLRSPNIGVMKPTSSVLHAHSTLTGEEKLEWVQRVMPPCDLKHPETTPGIMKPPSNNVYVQNESIEHPRSCSESKKVDGCGTSPCPTKSSSSTSHPFIQTAQSASTNTTIQKVQSSDSSAKSCGRRWGDNFETTSEAKLCSYPTNTFYGLPMQVLTCLEEHRGIKKLYDWQDTCLCLPSVVQGRNLIYSLPTSGGKTLVAEVIIFRQLLLSQKDALFILPFVSIVQEKVRELSPFASTLGFAVEEYAASRGKIPPRRRRRKRVVYIATIEKANALVNSLIEQRRMDSLGLAVVDELHMIGDGSMRGATLEACLAKIQYCSTGTQVVGMSATLSNLSDLAAFLRAEVYSNNFRPVELQEFVKVGRCVYSAQVKHGNVNFEPARNTQDWSKASSQCDPDQLCSLVMEVLPHNSCLLFCPTKKNCQNVALLLARCLPISLKDIKLEARRSLLKLLSIEASGVCPVLAETIPYGIAYHHSGLTADERRVIEEGYLGGSLCLLACTSTLAAGVNLPAKRVILRSPYVGTQFLSRSQYKQMVGRAGRTGLCATGESILLVKHRERERVAGLLSGPYDHCASSLLVGGASAMRSLILTLIGLQLVRCVRDLLSFLESTLLSVQEELAVLTQHCEHALSSLVTVGYITMETSSSFQDSTFQITSLGKATYRGCLPVEAAHVIHQDLLRAQRSLVLSTDLHLLFLATPTDLSHTIQPNWMVYFEMLTGMGQDELKVAELVGVSPGFLSKKATGLAGKMSDSAIVLYHRFYLSLMLHSLLRVDSYRGVWAVAEQFQCSRGFLQNVSNSTAAFASSLVHFTEDLPELWSLHLLLPAIAKKLAFTASFDLVPLMEIPGVKQGRARQLLTAGYRTAQDIAAADPHTLCTEVEHLFLKHAQKLIQAAKSLLADQAEALMEEAEELMGLIPQNTSK